MMTETYIQLREVPKQPAYGDRLQIYHAGLGRMARSLSSPAVIHASKKGDH